jgi:hypothetical protein
MCRQKLKTFLLFKAVQNIYSNFSLNIYAFNSTYFTVHIEISVILFYELKNNALYFLIHSLVFITNVQVYSAHCKVD